MDSHATTCDVPLSARSCECLHHLFADSVRRLRTYGSLINGEYRQLVRAVKGCRGSPSLVSSVRGALGVPWFGAACVSSLWPFQKWISCSADAHQRPSNLMGSAGAHPWPLLRSRWTAARVRMTTGP